jgi:galactokinase
MTARRWEILRARFERSFGASTNASVARAPGRVNLIGEHTDYNGLPVFPMAIQRDVALFFRERDDDRVRLCNVDERYAPREFAIADDIAPFERGDWGNYVKCAAQALRKRAGIARGIDAAVHGDIPTAAGLSSSSAMVVASALALIAANEIEIDSLELMSLLAEAERYIGTHSGGMDQAISLAGRRGEAVMIEFDPLRLTRVRVPQRWCFVIANTLVRAEKSGAAQSAYNARTIECRAALSALLAHPSARRLWNGCDSAVEPTLADELVGRADRADLTERTTRSRRTELARAPTTYAELLRCVPAAALLDAMHEALSGVLLSRFRHVVSEGRRVAEARAAMSAGDIAELGRLMNASHASLRDDYEVSCRELDRLVECALGAGAHGARLTGAGFGGCIVALCEANRCDELVAALRREIERFASNAPRDAVLVAEPSDGASVIELES